MGKNELLLIEKLEDIIDAELKYSTFGHSNIRSHYKGRHEAEEVVKLDDYIEDAKGVGQLKGVFAVINVEFFDLGFEIN